ncbi:MAG: YhfC family glutamic-type intramembrane protease [bacterium JZ-2024 1]
MKAFLLGEYLTVFLFLLNFPIFLGVFLGRKWRIPARFWFFGLIMFLLIQILHFPAAVAVQKHPHLPFLVKALLLGILAGIYEEGGRWMSFRWFFPSIAYRTQALVFGAGWAGMEIFLIALSLGGNFVALFLLDVNSLASQAQIPEEARRQAVETLLILRQSIENAPWYGPFLFVLGRISVLFWQMLFTFLVFSAVKEGKWWRWWYALGLHTLINFGAVLFIPWMTGERNIPFYPRVLVFELGFFFISCLALGKLRKFLLFSSAER